MIKKLKIVLSICISVLIMSSCSITAPLAATSNTLGKKVGEAKATIVFGLVFGGDYSVQTAMKNGGLTKCSTVDVKTINYLNAVIIKKCIVTGD
ncbi:MAG: hypothetical protein IPM51_16330 [Sphingobacteriaceae bacterium]|nr:hypothetical protein [Sphingobacteriaceae bacterium]